MQVQLMGQNNQVILKEIPEASKVKKIKNVPQNAKSIIQKP